ncbi:hypothetical protein JZ751_003262 [Albula glossodonta]|uniref:Uncharacterized protein n=1 Tax=Albula glossodonta TaxID=121402 RepID=A0A8T2MMK9_9TELE|nr:hypothetical protein JZ751_003262 [Albula glossodonta]
MLELNNSPAVLHQHSAPADPPLPPLPKNRGACCPCAAALVSLSEQGGTPVLRLQGAAPVLRLQGAAPVLRLLRGTPVTV